jgi:hypothetical protein
MRASPPGIRRTGAASKHEFPAKSRARLILTSEDLCAREILGEIRGGTASSKSSCPVRPVGTSGPALLLIVTAVRVAFYAEAPPPG